MSATAWAAPEATGAGGGITDPTLLSVISTVGDDVFATVDLSSLLDPVSVTPTQHFGPYASGSPDSGTCGNDWAEDSFNRVFTVRTSNTGEITVVEQFKDGNFVTNGGPSPAACDPTYTNHGHLVNPGVTGGMHGYFIVPLPAGEQQISTDSSCVAGDPTAPCTTAGFIDSHFLPCYASYVCQVTTFLFHYSAGDQTLLYHEWKNASPDRGGNSGDIANS